MSHFTVLVVGGDYEKQLEPYEEETTNKKYLTFDDREAEMFTKYMSSTLKRVVMPNGRLLSKYDDIFRIDDTYGIGTNTHNVPDNLEVKDIAISDIYDTFDSYAVNYCGYIGRDKEKNKYGYWGNVNAKWDWYLLGGRWTGYFKLKNETAGVIGKPGVMTKSSKRGYADSVLKKDIDIDNMELSNGSFSVFAVLKNYKWYERGSMGWWGMVSDEKNQIDWDKEVFNLISEVEDNTLLSIIDCHI